MMKPTARVKFRVELILQNGNVDYRDENTKTGLTSAANFAESYGVDVSGSTIGRTQDGKSFDIPDSKEKQALLTKFRQMRDNPSGSEQVVDFKLHAQRIKE